MSRPRVVTRAQSSQVHVKVAALLHFYKVHGAGAGDLGWDGIGWVAMGWDTLGLSRAAS